jgi:hypothetical protein
MAQAGPADTRIVTSPGAWVPRTTMPVAGTEPDSDVRRRRTSVPQAKGPAVAAAGEAGLPSGELHVHARHVMQAAVRGAHRHLGAADAADFSR